MSKIKRYKSRWTQWINHWIQAWLTVPFWWYQMFFFPPPNHKVFTQVKVLRTTFFLTVQLFWPIQVFCLDKLFRKQLWTVRPIFTFKVQLTEMFPISAHCQTLFKARFITTGLDVFRASRLRRLQQQMFVQDHKPVLDDRGWINSLTE